MVKNQAQDSLPLQQSTLPEASSLCLQPQPTRPQT